MSVAPPL